MRNESLNNTCILFDPLDEAQQKAIIKFYNDNGWRGIQVLNDPDKFMCIGVWEGELSYYYSCFAMQVIELPTDYYPTKIVESEKTELEIFKAEHKIMLDSFNMILQKRNSAGWDAECSAILAEETLKKITRK
jgi:hypothetical protein